MDKFKTVPVELSKLSNAAGDDVARKTVYEKLVIKVSAIDTKIPSTGGLLSIIQINKIFRRRLNMLTRR